MLAHELTAPFDAGVPHELAVEFACLDNLLSVANTKEDGEDISLLVACNEVVGSLDDNTSLCQGLKDKRLIESFSL